VRNVPVKILRGQGYEIVEAANGKEAIEHLETGQPCDLLFADVVLPGGMNGVELAEEAKRIRPSITVLHTTGYAENAVMRRGELVEEIMMVNKPYRRAELLEKIRATLDGEKV
jgi:CheY-like chemotaxis protein